jgi:fibro-slime domain-containing protein
MAAMIFRWASWSVAFGLGLGVLGCGGGDEGESAGNGGGGGSGGGKGGGGGLALGGGGSGGGTGASAGTGGDAGPSCGQVVGAGRDFKTSHPDFECTKDRAQGHFVDPYDKDCGPWDPAIVGALGSALGADAKPVYAGGSKTPSTNGKQYFDQWYRDVAGVNQKVEVTLQLTPSANGTLVYDTDRFFPLDDLGFDTDPTNPDKGAFFDDDMKARNFHFTYELHTTFRYQAGNVFTFRGDDDVFVYIDGKLVVNLGGIHVPMQAKLELDTGRVEITTPLGIPTLSPQPALGFDESLAGGGVAGTAPLALTPGEIYAMDFFFAERNCCASNFRLETNFEFIDCGVVK